MWEPFFSLIPCHFENNYRKEVSSFSNPTRDSVRERKRDKEMETDMSWLLVSLCSCEHELAEAGWGHFLTCRCALPSLLHRRARVIRPSQLYNNTWFDVLWDSELSLYSVISISRPLCFRRIFGIICFYGNQTKISVTYESTTRWQKQTALECVL